MVLFEKDDLAGGTSSASSKLIHGGLRYLEHLEFRLVREALAEREVLLQRAPHPDLAVALRDPARERNAAPLAAADRPLRFTIELAARRLIPASGALDLTRDPAGAPLRPELRSGFSYYDCWADDARLVIAAALDAQARGASDLHAYARHAASRAIGDRMAGHGHRPAGPMTFRCAGPRQCRRAMVRGGRRSWRMHRTACPSCGSCEVRTSSCRALQARMTPISWRMPTGASCSRCPSSSRFTLIGTTDVPVSAPGDGVPHEPRSEEDYLLAAAARFFARPLTRGAIVWRFAGVRPLVDDGATKASAVSRDYRLDLIAAAGRRAAGQRHRRQDHHVPVLGGGRARAPRADLPGMGPAWTANAPLPGGDFGPGGVAGYRQVLARRLPGISPDTLGRLVQRYGTRADLVLGGAQSDSDLGLSHRRRAHWRRKSSISAITSGPRTADDVLWRRTKAGLHIDPSPARRDQEQVAALAQRAAVSANLNQRPIRRFRVCGAFSSSGSASSNMRPAQR